MNKILIWSIIIILIVIIAFTLNSFIRKKSYEINAVFTNLAQYTFGRNNYTFSEEDKKVFVEIINEKTGKTPPDIPEEDFLNKIITVFGNKPSETSFYITENIEDGVFSLDDAKYAFERLPSRTKKIKDVIKSVSKKNPEIIITQDLEEGFINKILANRMPFTKILSNADTIFKELPQTKKQKGAYKSFVSELPSKKIPLEEYKKYIVEYIKNSPKITLEKYMAEKGKRYRAKKFAEVLNKKLDIKINPSNIKFTNKFFEPIHDINIISEWAKTIDKPVKDYIKTNYPNYKFGKEYKIILEKFVVAQFNQFFEPSDDMSGIKPSALDSFFRTIPEYQVVLDSQKATSEIQ